MRSRSSSGVTDGRDQAHRFGRIGPGQHGVHLVAARVARGRGERGTGPAGRGGAGTCRWRRRGSGWPARRRAWGARGSYAVDAHLVLLHGLEQGGLGPRGGPVELVGHQDVGEDGPGTEHGLGAVGSEHGGTDHVGGKQVGRALESAEAEPDRAGQRLGQGGLAQSGMVLDQEMAARRPGRPRPIGWWRARWPPPRRPRPPGPRTSGWPRCSAGSAATCCSDWVTVISCCRSDASCRWTWSGRSDPASTRWCCRSASLGGEPGPGRASGGRFCAATSRTWTWETGPWPARGSGPCATTWPPPSRWRDWPTPPAAPSRRTFSLRPSGTAAPTTAPT